MNDLKIFQNAEFGQMRTVEINGEPWFVGKDVAEALGYAKARNAIASHVLDEDKKDAPIQGTPGGTQAMTIINESGLYALIFGSKLVSAQRFKHWVTSEVLPAIRKTGSYAMPQGKELLALAVLEAQKTIEQQSFQIAEMKPKAIFADAVATSNQSILIGDLAKLICQNGYKIGQNRLFEWMYNNGFLIRSGSRHRMPTQKAMELKLFEVKERAIDNPDGSVRLTRTTKVTGKGQQYFINKFLTGGKIKDGREDVSTKK